MSSEQPARYEPVNEVKRDWCSVHYLANDSAGGWARLRVIAKQVLSAELLARRYFAAGELLKGLSHPSMTKLLDYWEDSSAYYLAFEHVEAPLLSTLLDRLGAVAPDKVLGVTAHLAEVLASAHAVGVVHGTLHPGVVHMLSSGEIKVSDFLMDSILAYESGGRAEFEGSQQPYVSPEQLGGSEIDESSDIYSLGAMMYRMLGGVPPFPAGSRKEILTAHRTHRPASLRALKPYVEPELAELVTQMLEIDPAQRPRSMQDVLGRNGELQLALESRRCPSCHSKPSSTDAECLSCGVSLVEPAPQAPSQESRHSRLRLVLSAALVVVWMAAVGAIVYHGSSGLTQLSIASEGIAKKRLEFGERYFQLGRFEQAEQQLHECLALSPPLELETAAREHLERIAALPPAEPKHESQ